MPIAGRADCKREGEKRGTTHVKRPKKKSRQTEQTHSVGQRQTHQLGSDVPDADCAVPATRSKHVRVDLAQGFDRRSVLRQKTRRAMRPARVSSQERGSTAGENSK